ncbi:MAG: polyprenyl synthetase family protein [Fibrobacteraceae bacterium]|nr:polyprenyl synthetase family protein [Fibrobacteraceae bacterium]
MNSVRAEFKDVLVQARSLVEDLLSESENVIFQVASNAPSGISERLETLFKRKGKRIRSTLLCLLASCGNEKPATNRVANACASIELLHLASLVHDDIIDGTELRRGMKTAHLEWGTQIAVLIGDYVLSQAMRCVINEENRNIPVILSDAADKLIAGEITELDYSGDMHLSREKYDKIIDGKTAALVDAAARIGAILAGFEQDTVEKCAKMGTHFGIAFQIIDDLLDYGVGSKNLDKAKFTDLSNGLITLPLLYYFEDCNVQEHNLMEQLIAKAAEEGVPEKILEKLNEKKSFEKAKATAEEHLSQALDIADSLPSNQFKEEMMALFASMSERGN